MYVYMYVLFHFNNKKLNFLQVYTHNIKSYINYKSNSLGTWYLKDSIQNTHTKDTYFPMKISWYRLISKNRVASM